MVFLKMSVPLVLQSQHHYLNYYLWELGILFFSLLHSVIVAITKEASVKESQSKQDLSDLPLRDHLIRDCFNFLIIYFFNYWRTIFVEFSEKRTGRMQWVQPGIYDLIIFCLSQCGLAMKWRLVHGDILPLPYKSWDRLGGWMLHILKVNLYAKA